MFCRNCGQSVSDPTLACPKCGVVPRHGASFCPACGHSAPPGTPTCTHCGTALSLLPPTFKGAEKRIPAGICAILLGSLGVHKFILGYTIPGLILLLITLVSCGWGAMLSGVVGIIEGILYLTKSDEEFARSYIQNQRLWF